MSLQSGQQLAHYRLVEKIGAGGMGVVWKAVDTSLGREVAIKFLPETAAVEPDRLARFEREARLLAAFNHPNIATVHGLHEAEGHRFLAMELVGGHELAALVQDRPLPVAAALEIGRQMAVALEAAHERGIIHRDLKPANVKLVGIGGSLLPDAAGGTSGAGDMTVKLLDFGLGKVLEEEARGADQSLSPTLTMSLGQTRDGVIMGTAGYMSPEQAHGRPADRRSDIWSFGCTLYQMLVGRPPFAGESVSDTLASILREEPDMAALPADVPPGVRRLLQRCLRKDPRRRLQSIGDARVILEDGLQGEGIDEDLAAPSRGTAGAGAGRGVSRGWLMGVVAGGLVLAAAAFLGGRFLAPTSAPALPSAGQAAAVAFSTFSQITFQAGLESSPALSPDGDFIAYVAEEGGDKDIFLLRTGGQRAINLTEDSPGDDDHPAFSRNGRFIAFRSDRGGSGLFVMGTTGEAVRRLTSSGDNPSWSPDGTHIVFATEGESDPMARAGTSELWVVAAAGGEPRRLFAGDAVQPAWSPGGQRIAYWAVDNGGLRDVWTMAADGTDPRPVTRGTSVDWNPVWDPAGDGLYFVSDRGGIMNLWHVQLDEASGEVRAEPRRLTVPAQWSGQFSISADGRHLAYRTFETASRLFEFRVDPMSGRLARAARAVFETGLPTGLFDVSRDGWIVVQSSGVQEDLYLMRTDGTGLRKLTDDVAKDRGPVWSPDGQEVAFYSNRGGRYEIWTMRADGSDLRQRTDTTGQEATTFPVWSPDGKSIFCNLDRGTMRVPLSASPVPTSEMQVIEIKIDEAEAAYVLSISPDGRWLSGIVLDARGAVMPGVVLHELATGHSRHLGSHMRRPVDDFIWAPMAWLPDSRRGLVRWLDEVLVVDVDTGEITPLMQDLANTRGVIRPLGAEGTFLMLDTTVGGDIWLASRP